VASAPVIDKLLSTVIQAKASDLFITAGSQPCLKKSGRLRLLETKVLDNDDCTALMKSITPDRCQQELQEKGGTDFAIEFTDGYRFRTAVFKQRGNIGIVMRRIPNEFLSFEQIGMPEVIKRLITRPRGLLLVTGPTGSGKTTSLASMVNFLNENYDRHIITLEDPIEYYHQHKKSIVNMREIGVDVPDFKEGIRRALRMAPDIIMVGEMRDLATIHAAIEAAETGHIVFGTLHTAGASSTINRIIDVFPKDQQEQVRTQLATALMGVLSQGLLPRQPEGMIAAYEMMVVTPAIQNLIRENKVYRIDSSIQTGAKEGMFLLDEHLFKLWKTGLCLKEDVLLKAAKPAELAARIMQAERGALDEDEDEDGDEDDDDDDDDEGGGGGGLLKKGLKMASKMAQKELKKRVKGAITGSDDDDDD
jgi:twitching motility protein PilT